MIFTPENARLILEGHKTQTRRLVKPGEWLWHEDADHDFCQWHAVRYLHPNNAGHSLKWQTGKTYAVQPGRTKAAIGRIRITAIRRERLQDISDADLDLTAEGIECIFPGDSLFFRILWDSIHQKPGTRWADSPDVWVLTFEVAK